MYLQINDLPKEYITSFAKLRVTARTKFRDGLQL